MKYQVMIIQGKKKKNKLNFRKAEKMKYREMIASFKNKILSFENQKTNVPLDFLNVLW
jgi:hypothetical protein